MWCSVIALYNYSGVVAPRLSWYSV